MKPLCIYHSPCADGFTAAWAVWRRFRDGIEFWPGVYGDAPPDVSNRDVIIVDFSYKRPVLQTMAENAISVLVLDHHKTAQEDLAPFVNGNLRTFGDYRPVYRGSVQALFDMGRSGAGIAWDFFFPGHDRPSLVNYVEDRDLWRFKLENSREVNAAIFSYEHTFENWDYLARMADIGSASFLADAGRAIERKQKKDIAELLGVTRRRMVIGGVSVPVANLPYTLTSDAGHLMATGDETKIGCCYWDTPEGRVFSLRSTDDGPDVSAIAKGYGGGGHAHASGFRMPLGWEGDSPMR